MKPLLASLLVAASAALIGAYALTENRSIANGGRLLAEAGSSLINGSTTTAATPNVGVPMTGPTSGPTTQTQTNVPNATGSTTPGTQTSTVPQGTLATPPTVQPKDAAPRILTEQPAASTNTQPSEPREQLEGTASSIRNLQQEVKTVENAVRDTVMRDVQQARTNANGQPGTAPQVFNADEREQRIREITDKLSQDVHTVIAAGEVQPDKLEGLQPVLKSSLREIQLLIKDETGVDVDLSPSARAVTDTVAANSLQLEKARAEVLQRKGLELYKDSDDDGISDYDEKHIYGTNPEKASTAGGNLTDGERVLLGFNPLSTSTERIPVESPKTMGEVAENIFEVHTINVELKPIEGQGEEGAPPALKETMTFAGRGLPNSFVTLYVFSTPVVVTVKADASGAWSYTLDSELEDGNHELYVATVDAGGRILAKSPVVPFIKRAQATEYSPLLVAAIHEPTPMEFFLDNLWLVGLMAFLVFGIIALVILGLMRSGPPATPTA